MEKRYHYITPEDYVTAEKNGLPAALVEQRAWFYDWDIDRAVTEPKRVLKCFSATWEKWREVAEENGVTRAMLSNRIRTLGWDEEEAATTPKDRVGKRGKWTPEEIAIAEKNGIAGNHLSLVNMRIKKLGWSKEAALNTPKLSREERAARSAEGTRKYHKERGVNSGFNKIV